MMVLVPGAALAALSGVAFVAAGAVVASLRPRTVGSLSFAGFGLAWGFAILGTNLARMETDLATSVAYFWAGFVAYVLLYVPLLFFLAWILRPRLARHPLFVLAAAVPAVVALLAVSVEPGRVVASAFVGDDGFVHYVFGSAYSPVLVATNVLGPATALAGLAWKLARAPPGAEAAARLALLAAAFVPYVAYRAANVGTLLVRFADAVRAGGESVALFGGAALVCAVAVAAVVALVLRREERSWRGLVLALAALGVGFGVFDAVAGGLVTGFSTIGLWRLVMVGVFAYGIARYHLFDLELRLAQAAPVAAYVALALAGLFLLWTLFASALLRAPLLATAASAGVLMVAAPARSLAAGMLARRGDHLAEPEYLYKRKLDVYRAALEEAQTRGAGERTEQLFLSELRRSLGITDAEHRVLLLVLEGERRYARPPPATQARKKFEIERELGRGSFGRALLARDTVLDRRVVLKQPLVPWMIDASGRDQFLQEARLAAKVEHPNVVRVYDVLDEEDPPMLVLEHVEGGSLDDLLARRGRLDADEATRIAADILRGLERIHALGIVHRDLKPANVLLDRDGVAKVTDFGVARAPPGVDGHVTIAATAGQPGSLAYMSPEQARGDPVDARSDLYSVGVVLYRMLVGRHYLDLRGAADHRARHLIDTASPDLSALPAPMHAVVARALAKDPAQRHADAGEMLRALSR